MSRSYLQLPPTRISPLASHFRQEEVARRACLTPASTLRRPLLLRVSGASPACGHASPAMGRRRTRMGRRKARLAGRLSTIFGALSGLPSPAAPGHSTCKYAVRAQDALACLLFPVRDPPCHCEPAQVLSVIHPSHPRAASAPREHAWRWASSPQLEPPTPPIPALLEKST